MSLKRFLLLRRDSWSELVEDLGRVSRFFFFAAGLFGVLALALNWDWSASTTPFAQLTLSKIGTSVIGVCLILGLGQVWFMWAFSSKPEYEKWAWLSAVYAVGIIGAAFWVGR